ncbi:MAG: hypothetical protein CME59_17680 [Halioglobus sp.]|nr:hypothetical protein [Halioglobus sp.]|tara:strand:- start:1405 stop:1941 length:537 start_codon:yes stop_codon:yes gene_type:complete
MKKSVLVAVGLVGSLLCLSAPTGHADDKAMIDANTERALTWLRGSDENARRLLDSAAGVLVFPDVVEMGFGVGGEFGEGALLVDGQPVDYYATAGSTFGMAAETQYKAKVIFFMTDDALQAFRARRSLKVGQHVSVPVAITGRDALDSRESHVGMIFSDQGLVSDLVLDGDRITRIVR